MPKKTKNNPSPLNSHLGYKLRLVSNAVSHSFAKKLMAEKITVAEWVILREMYSTNEMTSPSVVANLTGLSRGAVSKLIDRLLQKGLVTRSEVSKDRRFQEIRPTKSAIKLIPKLASIADENDDFFFTTLTAKEKSSLANILVKLAEFHQLKTNPIK